MNFTIRGRVSSGGKGVPGLVVRAFDKDLFYDDLLGEATTDNQGRFQIVCERALFKELFERRPDIYLRVLTRDRSRTLLSTEEAVRFKAGALEEFNLEIPREPVESTEERRKAMKYFYDRSGNMYSIEDEKVLSKKETVEVFNEAGERFELPAHMADEFKLTPDEKVKALDELKEKLKELGKSLGICPMIDPANIFSSGCPAIDPANLQSLLGTHVLPQQSALLAGLLRAVLGGGCPNVDPANWGSILGSVVNPAFQQLATAYQRILGGCPAIDPYHLGPLVGTISILQQLQKERPLQPEVSPELKKKRTQFVMRALTDLEFRELIKKDPKKAFGKDELSSEDLQSAAVLDALLPLVDDVINKIAGNLLCT